MKDLEQSFIKQNQLIIKDKDNLTEKLNNLQ